MVPALLILFWLSFSLRILNGDVDNCYLSLTTAKRCAFPLISHVVFTIMLQVKCCSCLTDRKLELCRVTRCWRLHQFSSVQSLSCVWLFASPWIAARQASLSITNSRSSLKLTSIESVMPSSHLILCRPLLLLPPIPSSIRDFSKESTLHMRWPKYWSFS